MRRPAPWFCGLACWVGVACTQQAVPSTALVPTGSTPGPGDNTVFPMNPDRPVPPSNLPHPAYPENRTMPPVATMPATPVTDSPVDPVLPEAAMAREVLTLANQARKSNLQPPLVWSDALAQAAGFRSDDMVTRDYFSHVDPDGVDPFMLLRRMGIPHQRAAENIAWNGAPAKSAARQAMEGWLASSGHRANLLEGSHRRTGVGVTQKASGTWIFTQLFTD